MAVGAGPNGNPVAEPQLAGDVPVADVAHPAQVLLAPALRVKAQIVVLRHGDRRPRQRFHPHPPLCRDDRLDNGPAAIAVADRVPVGLDFLQRALGAQHLDDTIACLWHLEAMELRNLRDVHPPVQAQDAQDRQVMPLPNVIVGGVVPGRHLDCARTEFLVDGLVGDDRHPAVGDGQHDGLADQVFVAPVVRMDGDPGIAHHRLRARRRDRDRAATFDRVVQVIQVSILFFVLHLKVGNRALVPRAPVDDPRTAIDQPFFPQLDEDVADRLHVGRVHGEADARPIGGEAEAAHLLQDGVASGVVPLLHELVPGLPTDRFLGRPFLRELLFQHVLGGDRRVIRARHPERGVTEHPVPADQDILQRVHRVPHVQVAGDVRRWHRDGERFAGQAVARLEVAALLPGVIPALLDRLRVVPGLHRWHSLRRASVSARAHCATRVAAVRQRWRRPLLQRRRAA